MSKPKQDPEAEMNALIEDYVTWRSRNVRCVILGVDPGDEMRRRLREAAFNLAEWMARDAEGA